MWSLEAGVSALQVSLFDSLSQLSRQTLCLPEEGHLAASPQKVSQLSADLNKGQGFSDHQEPHLSDFSLYSFSCCILFYIAPFLVRQSIQIFLYGNSCPSYMSLLFSSMFLHIVLSRTNNRLLQQEKNVSLKESVCHYIWRKSWKIFRRHTFNSGHWKDKVVSGLLKRGKVLSCLLSVAFSPADSQWNLRFYLPPPH